MNLALRLKQSVILFIAILFLPSILSAASLRIEGDRAWLKAEDVQLYEVLSLFQQRGVQVSIAPEIERNHVSGHWENVEIGWLISQLVSPHSSMLEWKLERHHSKNIFQVSRIRIFPEGKPFNARPLSSKEKVFDVVEGENGVKYIRGEVLIKFSKDSSIEDVKALFNKLNGTAIETISPPHVYRIKLDDKMSIEDAILIAQEHEGVTESEPNLALEKIVNDTIEMTQTGKEINLDLVPGEVAIAVLDSGFDPAYKDTPFILDTYNAVDPKATIDDPTGHGTLTSLVAAGAVTPLGADAAQGGAPVISIKAFDKNGVTSTDTIIRAIEYASSSGAEIISMSWGSEVNSRFMETAMSKASQNGITLYAAAGNEPTGIPIFPAGYDDVIAVGGLNPDGTKWEKSNYGDFVEDYEPALANFNNQAYAGTSIASPYAAFNATQTKSE